MPFQGNVYGKLVHRKPDLSLEPDLAVSWEKVDATTVWRFKLREGVTFHNGNPFTADDVLFSHKRQTEETADMKVRRSTRSRRSRRSTTITVEMITNGPDPILLAQHARTSTSWIRSGSKKNNAFATNVVRAHGSTNFANLNANGTGPFMLKSSGSSDKRYRPRKPSMATGARTRWRATSARRSSRRSPTMPPAWPRLISGDDRPDGLSGAGAGHGKRLEQDPNTEAAGPGPELRTIFLGFDQWR